jgi:hypothetical protein
LEGCAAHGIISSSATSLGRVSALAIVWASSRKGVLPGGTGRQGLFMAWFLLLPGRD